MDEQGGPPPSLVERTGRELNQSIAAREDERGPTIRRQGGEAVERAGDHICCLEATRLAREAVAVRFIAAGLDRGERILWVSNLKRAAVPTRLLERHGIDTAPHIEQGALLFRSSEDFFLSTPEFDPQHVLARVREETQRAAADGFSGLRVLQEMDWAARALEHPQSLIAYERGLSSFLSGSWCSVLCLYPLLEFDAEHLLEVLGAHPRVTLGTEVVENIYAVLPQDLLGMSGSDSTLRHRLGYVERYWEATEARRRHTDLVELLHAVGIAGREATTAEGVIQVALKEICEYTGWPLGHAYLPTSPAGDLVAAGLWFIADPQQYGDFRAAAEILRFPHRVGLPGRVAASSRPEWIPDITRDPDFTRVLAGKDFGVHAAFAFPALSSRAGLLAVLEFFHPEPQPRDIRLLNAMQQVSVQLGEVLERKLAEEEVRNLAQQFGSLVESASDAILLADEGSRIIFSNTTAARLFGYDEPEMVGRPITELMPERYRERHTLALRRYLETGQASVLGRTVEFHGLRKDGTEFPLEISLASWTRGRQHFFSAIIRDMSERRQAEEEMRLLESAVRQTKDAVVITSADLERGLTILFVNPALTEITGYSSQEARGESLEMLIGRRLRSERIEYERLRRNLGRGESASGEMICQRKDGEEVMVQWNAAPLRDSEGVTTHFVFSLRDVTDQRRAEEASRRADRDSLTGLANRVVFVKRLGRAIERVSVRPDLRFAVLFLDLDRFKVINDSLGHLLGDQLLVAFARRLEGSVRPGDIVARFGGDEFTILLENITDVDAVLHVADRIQKQLTIPFALGGDEIYTTASIGIALSDTGYDLPEDVIRDADAAMYRAKALGKNRYEVFDQRLYASAVEVLRLETDLRRALERDEFRVYYQPIVSLETRDIVGLEALLRWQHPERGLLLPADFLPLAEETGLIVPIGQWVLREAVQRWTAWQSLWPGEWPLLMSVNLSGREFIQRDLLEEVEKVLSDASADPKALQIEITESVFIQQVGDVQDLFLALRAMGIQLCIDDFGTGYSALGYLHRFPVGVLKIDRLFVSQLGASTGDGEIVRAILALARSLQMKVVAEGVETEEQMERLREMKCEYGQGFLISPPMDPAQVETLLTRH